MPRRNTIPCQGNFESIKTQKLDKKVVWRWKASRVGRGGDAQCLSWLLHLILSLAQLECTFCHTIRILLPRGKDFCFRLIYHHFRHLDLNITATMRQIWISLFTHPMLYNYGRLCAWMLTDDPNKKRLQNPTYRALRQVHNTYIGPFASMKSYRNVQLLIPVADMWTCSGCVNTGFRLSLSPDFTSSGSGRLME